ncbi:MAG: ribonuclease J [Clostridia bacterium]|nr:ribonuclease J [Clostridia bacterium]
MQNDAKKERRKTGETKGVRKQQKQKKAAAPAKKTTKKTASKAASTKQKETVKDNKKEKKTTKKSAKSTSAERSGKKTKTKSNASSGRKRRAAPAVPVKVTFIGGLNGIGRNMTAYEIDGDMIVVDCGIAFPEQDMLGIDLVIPDFSYLIENKDRLLGVFITHGHEDHIGALPYLLKSINVPVYSTRLTRGLIENKLEEHGLLSTAKLNTINPGDVIKAGAFSVEAIHVNHSIPDSLGFAIKSRAGTIVQTGDFKIDSTPIDGSMIDLNRFARLGSEGVLCMLSDSTNAERPGYTESERKVGESLEAIFTRAGRRRIIIATFASNVHRVQQIINVAKRLGRKVALSGRSLETVITIGAQMGYLDVDAGQLVSMENINQYAPENLVIITTGSQGEPMSALSRMAFAEHKSVNIGPNDFVVISATPIPGNEKTVGNVINELMKHGAEVIYEKTEGVHVSGHACQEELKLMMGIVNPKFFIPVHGEQKHIRKHAMLAESMGIAPQNIYVADNGAQIEISEDGIKEIDKLPIENIFVDGSGVGDVGNVVIRDRKRLSEGGLVVAAVAMDYYSNIIVGEPEIISRGFVYVKESEDLMEDAREKVRQIVEKCVDSGILDYTTIKSRIRDGLSNLMYEKTGRNPVMLAIIMEV